MEPVLSWDNHPERKAWSVELLHQVDTHLADLEKGKPDSFIVGYDGLNVEKKRVFWAELVIWMAKFESSWNPANVYHEPPPLGMDSIGLLQLSYSDANNYHFPDALNPASHSLKDPLINLRCGMVILAHWLAKDKVVASGGAHGPKGGARYWSVLRQGGNHHYNEIRTHVKHAVNL